MVAKLLAEEKLNDAIPVQPLKAFEPMLVSEAGKTMLSVSCVRASKANPPMVARLVALAKLMLLSLEHSLKPPIPIVVSASPNARSPSITAQL